MNHRVALLFAAAALLSGCANYAVQPVLHPGTEKRHESFNVISKQGEAQLVFLGDSITHGWDGKGKAVWTKDWAPLKAANFGIGGDRTEHVLWRLEHGNFDGLKPKAIVLMIGTNNTGHQGRPQKELDGAVYQCTAEQTAEGIKAILAQLRQKCPDAKILVLGIFPRGAEAAGAAAAGVKEGFACWRPGAAPALGETAVRGRAAARGRLAAGAEQTRARAGRWRIPPPRFCRQRRVPY